MLPYNFAKLAKALFTLLKTHKNLLKEVAICFLFLSFIVLHFSAALSSITLYAAIGLLLLTHFKSKTHWFLYLLPVLVIYQLSIDLIVHHFSASVAFKEISTKVPLLFLASLAIPISNKSWYYALFFCGVCMCWLGFASVFNYLNHKAFLDVMILESKPLPIYSKVYHIEYSLMHGLICLLCIGFGAHKIQTTIGKQLLVLGIILFVLLHLLTTRTGILSTYIGLFIMSFYFLQFKIKLKFILVGFTCILLFAYLVYQIPSIKNRITNSIADLKSMQTDTNLNHKSVGQRWAAWQAASSAIQKKTMFGYGIKNCKEAVNANYSNALSKKVKEENKVKPHNIIIELAVESGVLSSFIYMLFFGFGIVFFAFKKQWFAVSVLSFLFTAGVFENIINRQAGALVFFIAIVSLNQIDTKIRKTSIKPNKIYNLNVKGKYK